MKQAEPTPQLALPIALSDKACFDNYWVGDNQELVSALRQVVQLDGPRLVYYYGIAGSGKSHLLYAVMRLAKQQNLMPNYLALNNLESSASASMLETVDASAIVCIDDIHLWAGDTPAEDALFTLFEQIKHTGGYLVVNAIQPPGESGFKLKDLVSRLSSGLVYPTFQLNEEQRFDAIKMRANYRGMAISDDAVRYLLTRLPRDTAKLFAVLDKIDQASLIEQRKITIPFLQSLFKIERFG